MLLECDDVVDDAPAHEAEVASVRWDFDLGDPIDHFVPHPGNDPLGQRLPGPRAPLRVDDIEPIAPACDHLRYQLRRILQVAVNDDDRVTRGRLHSRQGGHRLTKPARKAQHLDASVTRMKLEDQCLGPIRRRVDTEDQLPLHLQAIERGT